MADMVGKRWAQSQKGGSCRVGTAILDVYYYLFSNLL